MSKPGDGGAPRHTRGRGGRKREREGLRESRIAKKRVAIPGVARSQVCPAAREKGPEPLRRTPPRGAQEKGCDLFFFLTLTADLTLTRREGRSWARPGDRRCGNEPPDSPGESLVSRRRPSLLFTPLWRFHRLLVPCTCEYSESTVFRKRGSSPLCLSPSFTSAVNGHPRVTPAARACPGRSPRRLRTLVRRLFPGGKLDPVGCLEFGH